MRHYSKRTDQAYCYWVKRFIRFHGIRHPALLFLYRHVIGREVGDLGNVIRARKPRRLPVVMSREEVKAVMADLTGDKRLMALIMYGTGLRLMECLRLRVQDIDFSRNEIIVRDGKGAKDRVTM